MFRSNKLRLWSILWLVIAAGCGGGGGGSGSPTPATSSNNQTSSSQTPPSTTPSAWSAVSAFGGFYGGPAGQQSLAAANDGRAHLVFAEYPMSNVTSVQAFTKPASGSWQTAFTLAPVVGIASLTRQYSSPVARTDDAGNVLCVWMYQDFSDPSDRNHISNVFFSRRDPATGIWSAPQVLQSSAAGYARNPHLVVEANGTGWAVWTERTVKDTFFSTRDEYAVFASKFTPGAGWSAAEKITGDLPSSVITARVTTDRRGNPRAIIQWRQSIPAQATLYAARRSAAGSWGPLETLAVAVPVGGLAPDFTAYDLVADSDDDAIAMWREYDGTRHAIRSRHYTSATGWEPVLDITLPSPDSGFAPQLAMDPAGNAFIVWHEFDGTSYGIWTARFEKGRGWTTYEIISSPAVRLLDDATFPRIGFDNAGNAIAIWQKYEERVRQTMVRANYYSRINGWGNEETISSGSGISWVPEVAVSGSGHAVATWWQENGNLYQAFSATRAPSTP